MNHAQKVARLQEQMRENPSPVSLEYGAGSSNTMRSKSYKNTRCTLDFGSLNEILLIDREKAVVEPRVTMEQLVKATLPYGLIPPVVPEFKGITVGGAVMGGAAESSSHRWGGFHDACTAYEILCGDGSILRATPTENRDVFYGIAGSYGSIGALLSAEIQLVPAKPYVHVRMHVFSDPLDAVQFLREKTADFLDGIVFSKNKAVVIEGTMQSQAGAPLFPLSSQWYYQHVKEAPREEWMTLQDYLFRYDQGAFWMGAYLFHLPLLVRFLGQGVFKLSKSSPEEFSQEEVERFRRIPDPSPFWCALLRPFLTSRFLWKLQHRAEKWVQDRIIVQDFCIPESRASRFLEEALDDPSSFPMWLCPIKAVSSPQIFAPHLQFQGESRFINIGIYGLPSYYAPIQQITRKLEQKTHALGGRKVLYSRSYYTEDEFWQIYPREAYDALRAKTKATDVWHEITEKVLSV